MLFQPRPSGCGDRVSYPRTDGLALVSIIGQIRKVVNFYVAAAPSSPRHLRSPPLRRGPVRATACSVWLRFRLPPLISWERAGSDCPYWDYMDLRQAYVERLPGESSPLGFKVGRQAISYADNRVWGPGEWGNVGRYTWDAAKLIVDVPPARIDFIFGDRIKYDPAGFDGDHYQFHAYGVYATVEAYGANARLGYTFDVPWKLRIGAEVSYGSGDPNPGSGRYQTFDGLFGAVDSMYGRMNLFSWKNLHDYQASLSIKPTKKVALSLDWHFFRLDKAKDAWYYCNGRPQREDPTGAAGTELGHEIDLIAKYKCSEHLDFQTGYAHFFPGRFIRRTGPSPDADWVFVQLVYGF